MKVRSVFIGAIALVLMAGCSGPLQGPPDFQQTYGAVDEPCVVSTVAVSRCTAHVYLVNRGGQGVALATVVVPVSDATAAATSARKNANAKCGGYIPATPNGAEFDLACGFDLPAGKSVAGPPILQAIKFSAAANSGSSSSAGTFGAVNLGLAVVAGLIALVALGLAIMERSGRRAHLASPSGETQEPAVAARRKPGQEDDEDW